MYWTLSPNDSTTERVMSVDLLSTTNTVTSRPAGILALQMLSRQSLRREALSWLGMIKSSFIERSVQNLAPFMVLLSNLTFIFPDPPNPYWSFQRRLPNATL